ncbi:MAG TPA: hypothetical protein VFK10_18805, partial [Burkholderiaceae bacterium]|nr:hypothetical protein [Burkholderiaceae bacterium]
MATIETLLLPLATRPEQLWTAVAQVTHRWLAQRQVHGADAVVLLPFAELMMPARRALAEVSGWLPRVHTPRTLAAALGPPLPRGPGEITGDAAIDRATARELLRGHAWAAAWRQRDPRAFDAALHRLVRTAQMLRQAALSLPPAQRASWWDQARGQVGTGGMGATDRLLLQAAIEWAALSQQADTDSLYAHRAGACVVVTLGGDDAVALNVLRDAAQHDVPALHLSADPPALDPFDEWPEQCGFEVEVAPDAETEAMATAWHIAQQVHGGATPIALVAQDRALVRRVRALLERMHIDVVDETGWSLSTTRAGAHATAALRAARAREPCDDVLDWLKADLGDDTAAELSLLERLWRGARVVDARAREQALALWQREQARLDAFVRPGPRMLGRWLQAFDTLLFGAAHSAAWRDDPAAMQLRRALHLHEAGEGAWSAAMTSRWLLDEFSAWVDATLEEAAFVPPRSEHVSVVVTPLPRAIGRTFAVALLPGADEQRLGPLP